MKKKLLTGVAVFAIIAIGWHIFEAIWDQSLFPKEETGVTSRNIGVKELRELIAETPDLQLVDVRPHGSYESARLAGAVNAPFRKTAKELDDTVDLDTSRPVVLYCDGGFRSRLAVSAYKTAGFTEIYHLHRGILSWRLQGGNCESGESKL